MVIALRARPQFASSPPARHVSYGAQVENLETSDWIALSAVLVAVAAASVSAWQALIACRAGADQLELAHRIQREQNERTLRGSRPRPRCTKLLPVSITCRPLRSRFRPALPRHRAATPTLRRDLPTRVKPVLKPLISGPSMPPGPVPPPDHQQQQEGEVMPDPKAGGPIAEP